ncbi:serine O-acetyltransferase [Bacteroides difficilis]|uniref:Serine acetyltransferase n=1 Tax=Bacteroides difficilis TaxID=2763021 RepID=A0ABR7CF51_9BACE|nr:serine acetyltransferase [Bacteroides difficilis]MBC5606353.1 serine acetyltransferase [Bacteroides difficilis]
MWNLRDKLRINNSGVFGKMRRQLYIYYTQNKGGWIGVGTTLKSVPLFPHDILGVFISNSAIIGKNVIIYQHVTIGSNTLPDSKGMGAPVIEDGVLIGAGAKIIGNVHIGENARIGAGCIVTCDVPSNSVVVMVRPAIITKDYRLSNVFVDNEYCP